MAMRKLLLFAVLMLLPTIALITYVRYTGHEQGMRSRVERTTPGEKVKLAAQKTGVVLEGGFPEEGNRPVQGADYHENEQADTGKASPGFSKKRDKTDTDRFKEHLSHLFGLDRPPALQEGGSTTDPALPANTQDTGFKQSTGILPSHVEKTTSGEKTKSTSNHRNRGTYAGSGLSFVTKEQDKNAGGYESSIEKDPSHTSAKNARVGYRFNKQLALEIGLDYIPGLPGYELSTDSPALSTLDEAGRDVTTYMPAVKFSPDLGSKTARPYIVGGFGLMRAETTSEEHGPALWFVDPNRESELATSGKIGLGFELRKDNTSIGIEGNLASGFGDLADVVYQTWSMGLTLHW
ncbi:MAG: outer membrane beta-barrel protein [Desulfobacteria bacterium]